MMPTFVTSKARENILGSIRKALGEHQSPMPFPQTEKENNIIYVRPDDATNEEIFAEAFIALGGKFIFCDDEKDAAETLSLLKEERAWKTMLCANERILKQLNQQHAGIAEKCDSLPENAEVCITGCEAVLARTGSIIFSSRQHFGRTSTVYYPVHIVVAYIDQVVYDIDEALVTLKKKYKDQLPSMLNVTTGPSRTADIEKTLVVGVHGPGEIFCLLINSESGLLYK